LLEQQQVQAVWDLYHKMDLALVGIGSLTNSAFIERNVLCPDDLTHLRDVGAVGEICGRFYDEEGQECKSAHRDRVVSIRLEELRKIPQVVGVTAGDDRAHAVAVALRSGLLKSLVVDELCARSILAIMSEEDGGKKQFPPATRSMR
jgi:DNA-binding transcriptional regulator LsrR (DeoR family)